MLHSPDIWLDRFTSMQHTVENLVVKSWSEFFAALQRSWKNLGLKNEECIQKFQDFQLTYFHYWKIGNSYRNSGEIVIGGTNLIKYSRKISCCTLKWLSWQCDLRSHSWLSMHYEYYPYFYFSCFAMQFCFRFHVNTSM